MTDDLDVVCRNSDVLVVTNKEKDFADVLKNLSKEDCNRLGTSMERGGLQWSI